MKDYTKKWWSSLNIKITDLCLVLSIVAEVVEKIVNWHLHSTLPEKTEQGFRGFVTKSSSATSLNDILSFTGPKVKARKQVDTVYFDFKIAFENLKITLRLL